jgi:excisionase family DNA binding protein
MAHLALSIDEASQAARVGRMAIYNAINSGALPARKHGKRTLILAADLQEWLRNLPPFNSASARRCAPRRMHEAV